MSHLAELLGWVREGDGISEGQDCESINGEVHEWRHDQSIPARSSQHETSYAQCVSAAAEFQLEERPSIELDKSVDQEKLDLQGRM